MAKRKLPPGVRIFKEHPSQTRTVFRVWLSSKFLGKGMAPERRGFATDDAAREWIQQRWEEIHPLQAEATRAELSPDQIADAKAALAKLAGRASLTDAAFYWDSQHAAGESKTVASAIESLHADRKAAGLSPRHCREVKAKLLRLLGDHLKKTISSLTAEELEAAVAKADAKGKAPSHSQRAKRLRYFSILAEFSIARGWLSRSPASSISRPRISPGRPSILTPEDCKKLLAKARPELLPSLALKLFAGVRNAELYLARWQDFKETTIRVQRTKNSKPRSVPTEKTLFRHLPKKRPKEGLIFAIRPEVKDREAVWLEEITALAKAAEVKIPQNALRHTFGTYHCQRCKDYAKTAFVMGNSPKVCQSHYVDAVDDKTASKFWAL